jgi:sugar phosphate isomerase/epimerase
VETALLLTTEEVPAMTCSRNLPTLGFIVPEGRDIENWASFAGEQELSIELLFNQRDPAAVVPAAQIRRACEAHGTGICALGLWRINYLAADPAEREANHALFRAGADYAAEVGACVFFSDTGQLAGDLAANVAEYREVFPPLLEYVESRGMTYATYMGHPGNFLNCVEALRALCEAMPELKLKIDPVGLMRNVKAEPLPVFAEFGHRVGHFHVKDILRVGDHETEPPIGYGQLPWAQLLGLLYEHDYEGHVVIEPHGAKWGRPEHYERHIRLSLPLLRQLVG